MSRYNHHFADHAHRYAFEGTVLERVLLAIIKAHTAQETEGEEYRRLAVAMNALTGPADRPQVSSELRSALDWMSRERRRDLCSHDLSAAWWFDGNTVRPVRELAILAAYEFLDPADGSDMRVQADRLCALFKAQRHASVYEDASREVLESEAVERISAELAEWDAPQRY